MNTSFSSDFFTNNRRKLRAALETDAPIVITAHGQLQLRADSVYPFSQDSSFWYLTGLTNPDLTLVIDGSSEHLIVPELSTYQNIFDGSLTASELTACSGIQTILPKKEGWKALRSRLRSSESVATLPAAPPYLSVYGMYTNPARRALIRRLRAANPRVTIIDMRLALAKLRAIKQPVELSVMQAAIDLTIAGIELVKTNLTSYKYEYQVEADITANNLRNGAVDVWKPIVAAGKNSCILHSSDNQSPLRNGDMIVIDVGSEIEHYCSDITRTYAIGTQASPRQQAVYDAVKEIQAYGFSLQKPGSLIRENEALVEAFMGEQLRKLGLISSTERKAIRHYFPHATSHFLGLDPHDTGDYDAPLQAGMVLTVEPGIYIPEESIGVRIEDDVLITDTGYHVMSDALPRTIT